ncbi:MAG TPA: dienelactone hydrolase family protein, partial [Terriglobia bacterium]|nr:dienelactone hydrolase family protein [Terriglobia bacterium]
RYLVSPGTSLDAPLLVGFHGYGETAEEEMARLQTIPGIDRWAVASIQGLHPFYRRRTNEVVASWRTRQNRELAIADNIAYVSSVLNRLSEEPRAAVVLTGFSQGVAMAFRAAAAMSPTVAGVIACGGDVPPELDAHMLARIPIALIGQGARDEWYTSDKRTADETRLHAAGVTVQSIVLDAGHEWTAKFSDACARFLQSISSR